MRLKHLLLVAVLMVSASACKTTKLVDSKTTTTKSDSTYTEAKKIKVKTPGWDLGIAGNIGSRVVFVPVPGKPGQTEPCVVIKNQSQSITDKEKIKSLQFQLDSLGNYSVTASQREHELQVEVQEKTRIIKEHEKTIQKYVEKETWFKSFIKQIAWGTVGLFVVVGIALYLFNKFRPRLI